MRRGFGAYFASERLGCLGFLATLVLLGSGCSSPDTEAEFGEFTAATEDMRAGEVELPDAGEAALQSGRHFMAVSTVVMPAGLIFIEATVTVADDGASADFSLQPLKTDLDEDEEPRPDPRTPVGEPVVIEDVAVSDGSFTIEVGEVTIDGAANPITTGAEIVATLTLIGIVAEEGVFCGTADGTVTQPLPLNINGSSFSAVRTDEDFTEITMPVARCPEGGGEGDPAPDAGTD